MSRDPLLFLEDIERSCGKIVRYTGGLERSEFFRDELRFDAVLHNFQVIGEAVKRLPDDLRQRHSDVAWREIAGMRDFVAHQYFALDLEIVWDAIQRDVPALLRRLGDILEAEKRSESGASS